MRRALIGAVLLGLILCVCGDDESSVQEQLCVRNGEPTYAYCNNLNDVCTFCSQAVLKVCNCNSGSYCRSVDAQCIPCPGGRYCPSENMTTTLPCPSDSFCPKNSAAPMSCNSLSICDEESSRYYFVGGIPFDIVIVVALILSRVLYFRQRGVPIAVEESTPDGEEDDLGGKVFCEDLKEDEQGEVDEPRKTNIDLEVIDLSYSIVSGGYCCSRLSEQVLLTSVSGKFSTGTLTGILGPSGSGKTTLLNVLSGRLKNTGGSLLVNDLEDDINRYQKVIGYVPQDDILLRNLTVSEILYHSANLRLPETLTAEERKRKVNDTIKILSLEHVRNVEIGDEFARGISGGERKRVNIASELVAGPAVLFLDEPTTGLDSASAFDCIQCLKKVADIGTNVICVLHQPGNAAFAFFDKILLLSQGGRIAYLGPSEKCVPYFVGLGFTAPSFCNVPDFLLDVLSGKIERADHPDYHPDDLLLLWQEQAGDTKPLELQERAEVKHPWIQAIISPFVKDEFRVTPGYHLQFLYYLKRCLIQEAHSMSSLLIYLLMYLFTGVYLGIAFLSPSYELPMPSAVVGTCSCMMKKQLIFPEIEGFTDRSNNFCSCTDPLEDNVGLMGMYFCMGVGVLTAAASCTTFGSERHMFWRESGAGVKLISYFIAKAVIDAIKGFLYSVFFLSTFILIAAPYGSYGSYLGIIYVLIFAVQGLGYIASLILSPRNAAFVAVLTALPWSVTSGYVFEVGLLSAFGSMSYPRWVGQATFVAETEDLTKNAKVELVVGSYADTRYGYDLDSYTESCGYVLLIGVVFRVIAFACLKMSCYLHRR